MVKAVIVDLDRTLLRNDKSVSDYTVNTLKACKDKGIKLIAATARPGRAIRVYDEKISFNATVTLNGAVVATHDNTIQSFIKQSDVEHIVAELNKPGDCVISLETTGGIYSNVDIPEWNPKVYENLLTVPMLDKVYKIIVSSAKHNPAIILSGLVSDNVYYSIANNELFQIMSKEATKWNGIKTVLMGLGIDPEEVIYFGDDYDDIEPIKMCGIGVAVSNAIAEVKDVADYIADSNESDGVAKYLNEKVLSK